MILEPTQASRHHVDSRILPPTNTYFGTKPSYLTFLSLISG